MCQELGSYSIGQCVSKCDSVNTCTRLCPGFLVQLYICKEPQDDVGGGEEQEFTKFSGWFQGAKECEDCSRKQCSAMHGYFNKRNNQISFHQNFFPRQ